VRIRLVEPRAISFNVYDHSLLPRLGLPLLGKIMTDRGHDVRIYVEVLAPVDWDDLLQADIVGFSTTTATTPPAFEMADRLRAQGKTVVFGGAHVTFLPDEALEHADYVVRGEGQVTFVELVNALEQGGDVSDIAGLSYHGPDGPVHNPVRPNCDNEAFAALPPPDLSLIVGHERMQTYPLMTQWGCPFNCNFCSVIKMFGRRVRARRVEDVLDELETVPPGKSVFFYDDNFVVDKRRTKALLRGMIERGLNIPWSAQMRAEAIYIDKKTGEWDTELLELMHETGCDYVYVGFESVNPEALEEFNKQQTVEVITGSIEAFHEYGVPIHGMFILGCDADTPETIEATVKYAIKQRIDTVQFLIITPLPGTEFYAQMEADGRIISDDWALYDGHHVLTQPAHMTPYELQRASFRAMLRFYAPRRAWRMLFGNVRRELPFLLHLFVRERKLRIALPRIALMSIRPQQLLKIPQVLQQKLDLRTWLRLRDVFIVPILRRYAYRHTKQGLRQPQNKHYVAWLRSLARSRHRGAGMA
jgi:anaerobic magnesium-protoporphyrin IX monomethyl ester cyclase